MKKTIFALAVLLFAGCASNSTPMVVTSITLRNGPRDYLYRIEVNYNSFHQIYTNKKYNIGDTIK
jgi:hypothetical protein